MSFLNDFTDDKYKKDPKGKKKQKSDSSDDIQLPDQPTDLQVAEERIGSFQAEKIEIDRDYYKYSFGRTVVICGTILIIILIAIGLYFISGSTTMPDFKGQTAAVAEKWGKTHTVSINENEKFSNTVDKGKITKQSVEAGSKIGRFGNVDLIISKGPNLEGHVDIPDFKGEQRSDIESFVKKNGMVNAQVVSEYNNTIKKDKFIRMVFTDPNVNTSNYTRNDSVVFYVSGGKNTDDVTIPVENFVNKKYDEAAAWADENGVMIEETEVANDTAPAGYVVSQSIEPGEMIAFGQKITLEVSKGQGTPAPDFGTMSESEISSWASENQVTINPIQSYSDTAPINTVYYQSVAVGEPIYPNDTVDIYQSIGQVFVPDFTGQTINDVEKQIADANQNGANISYAVNYISSSVTTGEGSEAQTEEMPKGTVESNSYAGQYVYIGTTLTINVYK